MIPCRASVRSRADRSARAGEALIGLLTLIVVVAVVGLLAQTCAFGGAWFLHSRGYFDDEIRWLQTFRPILPWERGIESRLATREFERVERALYADRLDRAVHLFRAARLRARQAGLPLDDDLVGVGLETFRRASDRMIKHGRLSEAADWNDSAFVLAVRAPVAHHRYAALAGFMEGLDLRVRDGKPCDALARVRWAKKGLGGVVPGMGRTWRWISNPVRPAAVPAAGGEGVGGSEQPMAAATDARTAWVRIPAPSRPMPPASGRRGQPLPVLPCVTACPPASTFPGSSTRSPPATCAVPHAPFSRPICSATRARVAVEVLCVGLRVQRLAPLSPIQIGRLQRYAVENPSTRGRGICSRRHRRRPTRVACVGAGPASLAVAGYLALEGRGHRVREAPAGGGLNTTGVAPYKMRRGLAVETT
jgi:hypothetical protein